MLKVRKLIRSANNWVLPQVRNILPLWLYPKHSLRFKAYCLGAAKTGTTSIYSLFSEKYRSAHDVDMGPLCNWFVAFSAGKISKDKLTRLIKRRDRRLDLEMNSCSLNYLFADILANEFKEAKFILTIRDCYSWLNSWLDERYYMNLYLQAHLPIFRQRATCSVKLDRLLFGTDEFKHEKEEAILAKNGLYTLEGGFRYWAKHNSGVIAAIPPERLLIVKTSKLKDSVSEIETFLGLPQGSLPITQAHKNVTGQKRKCNFLAEIDRDFLEEKANLYCKDLMAQFFPEINNFNSLGK